VSVTEDELIKLRARAAEVTARVHKMTDDLERISREIKAVSVTATSGDKLVKATVGPDGKLTTLELHPEVYDYHPPHELAREIEETIATAAAEAQQRVMALCRPFVSDEQMRAALSHDYQTLVHGMLRGQE
jgi:DNA-binding protein YbaB